MVCIVPWNLWNISQVLLSGVTSNPKDSMKNIIWIQTSRLATTQSKQVLLFNTKEDEFISLEESE